MVYPLQKLLLCGLRLDDITSFRAELYSETGVLVSICPFVECSAMPREAVCNSTWIGPTVCVLYSILIDNLALHLRTQAADISTDTVQ